LNNNFLRAVLSPARRPSAPRRARRPEPDRHETRSGRGAGRGRGTGARELDKAWQLMHPAASAPLTLAPARPLSFANTASCVLENLSDFQGTVCARGAAAGIAQWRQWLRWNLRRNSTNGQLQGCYDSSSCAWMGCAQIKQGDHGDLQQAAVARVLTAVASVSSGMSAARCASPSCARRHPFWRTSDGSGRRRVRGRTYRRCGGCGKRSSCHAAGRPSSCNCANNNQGEAATRSGYIKGQPPVTKQQGPLAYPARRE
jgi:hypothetical protein